MQRKPSFLIQTSESLGFHEMIQVCCVYSGLFFIPFPPVPSECSHLGKHEQGFCMRIYFHNELSFLSTEHGSGVRIGSTQPTSCPSFYIKNSCQKLVTSILPPCLSVSFILLPIPFSRADFHQKTPQSGLADVRKPSSYSRLHGHSS